MRTLSIVLSLFFASFHAYSQQTDTSSAQTSRCWIETEIGIIGTASSDILKQAMALVKEKQCAGLTIVLDTPGGSLEETRTMVKEIMASPYPVLVWVGPSGSRAASAGAFITLASHVAAMAPGTNIGAATPISASGENVGDSDAGEKVKNDTIAFIESIASSRDRNVEIARSFVSNALSVTETEALEKKIIDLVVPTLDHLYAEVNGREVKTAVGLVTLDTQNIGRIQMEKTFRQRLLEIISNPNLFYLLFLAGIIGIGFELTHPGVLFPGVLGGICLVLALVATSVLPISWGAAALILLGVALLVAETFVTSFGILGIGGIVAFTIGSIFLVDPNNAYGMRISLSMILPATVLIAAVAIGIGILVTRATFAKVNSGREALIGQDCSATGAFEDGIGYVRLSGALWRAKVLGQEQVSKDDHLEVVGVDGITVSVRKKFST